MSDPTIDERRTLRQVRCVVACVNANGEPDLFFVRVECTGEEYDHGAHYDCAEDAAKEEGYEPHLAYDEHDAAGSAMMVLFEWDTASAVRAADKTEEEADDFELPAGAARHFYIHNVNGRLQEFVDHKASMLDLVLDAIAYEAKYSGITRVDITGLEDNFWQGDEKVENTGIRTLIEFYAENVHPQGFTGRWTLEGGWVDSATTCTPGNCVGSGDCVNCCPDCDALRSDGYDDGPCERHAKAEMSKDEFKAWLTTQTREAAAKIIKDLIVKEARAQGITGLHLRESRPSSFRVDDHRRVDTTPISELLTLYHVAIDPAGLKATWTEEDGWQEVE